MRVPVATAAASPRPAGRPKPRSRGAAAGPFRKSHISKPASIATTAAPINIPALPYVLPAAAARRSKVAHVAANPTNKRQVMAAV
jgi:hypothetical protein